MMPYVIFFAIFLAFTGVQAKSISTKNLTPYQLSEFFNGTFSTRTFNGVWMTGNTFLFRNTSTRDFDIYDVTTQTTSVLFDANTFNEYTGASITLSPDLQYVLVRYNVVSVFRHSTTSQFAIYDINTREFHSVADDEPCQIASWDTSGHGLVYVRLNNIYYVENPGGPTKTITADGIPDVLYNGVPDWVYEEEVLGSGSALWFSPSGKKIAFASFNDTLVEDFKYFLYGTPGSLDNQYPTEVDIKYPKVGTKNPDVKVFVADLETGETPVEVPTAIPARWYAADDYVLYDMRWINDDELAVISTNRVQNRAALLKCPITAGGDCVEEFSYESTGWLEPAIPRYSRDGTSQLEILPVAVGDDFFNHIVLTDVPTKEARNLTSGRFVVSSIYGWDEANDVIYFLGSRENEPSQRQVYSVSSSGSRFECLTCDIETSRGPCLYAAASFSKDLSYVTTICQGPGPYLVHIKNTLDNSSPSILWEDNQQLIDNLATKLQPVIKNLKVPIEGGHEANVRLFLPPSLDENGTKKYPAVVYVYAGPDTNQITDLYSSGFQNYITTNREYIYIYIDGRGSGRDGQRKTFEIYRRLGTVEIEDQIAVTKHLQEQLPYIDESNTGIWGWSYGGFAAAWALVKDESNVFKFGMSVAPVTSFIYYDTIYTERYMGLPTPEDNELGYNNTDVTRNVEQMRGKLYLLIHGNADDNVHYQQAMALTRALEVADIEFRQQSYPDENHSLGSVTRHLYHTIDRFWARSFGLSDPPRARDMEGNEIIQESPSETVE